MSTTTFEHWNIDNLKNHHLNAEVFGQLSVEADCTEFVESIKEQGIIEPVIVIGDGTIISGHRRMQGAARAGLKKIDVIVRRDLKDQESIDAAWFHANKQREMTNEQKARWTAKREPIFVALAQKRQKAGKHLWANLPKGRAAEAAAAEVGMSRRTSQDAQKVVAVIDQAEAGGDTETATKLRETLNGKSVSAAKREADKVNPPKKRKPSRSSAPKPPRALKELSQAVGAVSRALEKAGTAHGKGAQYASIFESLTEIKMTISEWKP